jgi:hypothetical protein
MPFAGVKAGMGAVGVVVGASDEVADKDDASDRDEGMAWENPFVDGVWTSGRVDIERESGDDWDVLSGVSLGGTVESAAPRLMTKGGTDNGEFGRR